MLAPVPPLAPWTPAALALRQEWTHAVPAGWVAPAQPPLPFLQEAAISHLLRQGMLEHIDRFITSALFIEKLQPY